MGVDEIACLIDFGAKTGDVLDNLKYIRRLQDLSNLQLNRAKLQVYLKERLANYMVPSTIVIMDALPLTPNGKVDRGALAVPAGVLAARHSEYIAPRNSTKEVLAAIWAETLRVDISASTTTSSNSAGTRFWRCGPLHGYRTPSKSSFRSELCTKRRQSESPCSCLWIRKWRSYRWTSRNIKADGSAQDIIDQLDKIGAKLTLNGTRLGIRAPRGTVNAELKQQVYLLRAEIAEHIEEKQHR